jgi:flagellar biosynthesis repressor protein FlbT
MGCLVLELRQGELMVVNGAVLRFRTRTRVELETRARFLFGRQVMEPEQACTPLRQLYLAVQDAYVGPEPDRPAAMERARQLATRMQLPQAAQALQLAESGEHYAGLRVLREAVRAEEMAGAVG